MSARSYHQCKHRMAHLLRKQIIMPLTERELAELRYLTDTGQYWAVRERRPYEQTVHPRMVQ